jgi:hypothetical protein
MQNYPPPAGGPSYPPPGSPYGTPPPPAPPKKSKTPWIIAGVGCLVVVGIIVIALGGGVAYILKNAQSTQTTNVPEATQPAGTKQYVNTRAGRTGDLAKNYVDFSFYYPDNWVEDDDPEPNFVRVERKIEDASEGNFTQENFAVGWVTGTGTALDKQLLPKLAEQFNQQFSTQFPNYRKLSEGETKVGAYEGYEFKFTAKKEDTPKGDITLYGRVVALPPPAGQQRGVAFVMLATNLAPEIHGVDDVGVKGQMPVILDTFRFGSK